MTFEEYLQRYKRDLYRALDDEHIRLALRRGIASYRKGAARALEFFPEVEEKKRELKELKEYVLTHLSEMTKKTVESIERMDGHAHYARTVEDALKVVDEIVGSGKSVVKAKSITSEELDLNEHLEKQGNRVHETDLGEFIIQHLHSKAMHILSPAIHVPKEKVAELFSKILGQELPPDPPKLAMAARQFLREKFFEADIGISGANSITADTGSVFLIENEGNIRFATNAPPVHLVIAGVEKILPSMQDGMTHVEVTARYSSYLAPSYVSIISGPSKTGDIEKMRIYGMHGPKEFHVLLLDNGRSEAAKDPLFRQALYCIRCGGCMYECPVYPLVVGYWGYKYMGGMGIPWTAFVSGGLEKAAPMAYTCTLCGRCVRHCPMEIDVPKITLKLREMIREAGCVPENIRNIARNVVAHGTPYAKTR